MMPLGLLADGEQAMVVSISENEGHAGGGDFRLPAGHAGCHACKAKSTPPVHASHPGACRHGGRMEDMGIRAGKEVQMLKNPGRGPLLLKVDEARIAIGRAMAMRILVRRTEPK